MPESGFFSIIRDLTYLQKMVCPGNRIWLSEELIKSEALLLERKIKKREAKRFLADIDFSF